MRQMPLVLVLFEDGIGRAFQHEVGIDGLGGGLSGGARAPRDYLNCGIGHFSNAGIMCESIHALACAVSPARAIVNRGVGENMAKSPSKPRRQDAKIGRLPLPSPNRRQSRAPRNRAAAKAAAEDAATAKAVTARRRPPRRPQRPRPPHPQDGAKPAVAKAPAKAASAKPPAPRRRPCERAQGRRQARSKSGTEAAVKAPPKAAAVAKPAAAAKPATKPKTRQAKPAAKPAPKPAEKPAAAKPVSTPRPQPSLPRNRPQNPSQPPPRRRRRALPRPPLHHLDASPVRPGEEGLFRQAGRRHLRQALISA